MTGELHDPEPFHLFVAVPAAGDQITIQTAMSLLEIQAFGAGLGWTTGFHFFSGALLAEMRNLMVRDFMLSGAEALLMIDADQGFPIRLIDRLVRSGFPLVAAMSPHRRYAFDQVDPALSCADMDRVLQQATRYAGELQAGLDGVSVELHDGFMRAKRLGAGVMLIRREVIEAMKARFPELKLNGFSLGGVAGDQAAESWGFFNPMIAEEEQLPLSEDYSFCDRWRLGCGGELWAEVETPVTHVGRVLHTGAFLDHLRARYPEAVAASEAGQA